MLDENNKYINSALESARQGSVSAFMNLVRMNIGSVFTLSLRLTADRQKAEKLSKQVFEFAWDNIQQVRNNSSFANWLHSIAISHWLDEFRKRQLPEGKDTPSQRRIDNPVEFFSRGKDDLIIMELPELQRLIFILHDVKKYSSQEIADLLVNLSRGEVKALLRTARRTLIEKMLK